MAKSILNKKSLTFLENYINNPSPTGFESEGQKMWLDYIKPYIDDYFVDTYGTVVGVINPEAKYKVVIEAHADEIGWTVSHIDSKGFIRVVRNGGSDHHIAPGTPVKILGDNGIVNGHFGWLAIHERKGSQAKLTPDVNKLFIDVEASSKKEVEEMGIFVGTPLAFAALRFPPVE